MPILLGNKIKMMAKDMRISGHSLSEISNSLHISKSTASLLTAKEEITPEGKERILARQNWARQKGIVTKKRFKEMIFNEIDMKANNSVSNIKMDIILAKLLCSIFIWTEGEKSSKNRIGSKTKCPTLG